MSKCQLMLHIGCKPIAKKKIRRTVKRMIRFPYSNVA